MNTIKIKTSQNIELEYELASVGDRILGYLLDALIIAAYAIIFFLVLSLSKTNRFLNNYLWYYIAFYIPIVFYDLVSEVFMNGQTIGKKVMKVKVVSINGAPPSLVQYLIRWVFRLVDITVSFGMCGIICMAVSKRYQRLGDIVAGTALIKTSPRTTFHQTLYAPTQEDYQVTFPEVINLSDKDMQLLKEVLIIYSNSGNHLIVEKAAEKITETLHIQNNLEPASFLKVLLADYNFLTSRHE